jgi:hypothetical protein
MSSRPRISLVLLVYNQRDTVEAAALSCLGQVGEALEIVLSDDASDDGSFEILQRLADAYRGPHQVRARRNARNQGIGGHYNEIVACTGGALIVTAAGDDISLPHRVQTLARAWEAGGGRADLIASDYTDMASDGTLRATVRVDDLAALTLEKWLQRRPFVTGATHAFTRRMMLHFGPFIDGVWYEDTIMVFRALSLGGALTVTEPLVRYRQAGTSKDPARSRLTGARQRTWVVTQNRRLLAEARQLLQDAEVLGRVDAVRPVLQTQLSRGVFLDRLADDPSWAGGWDALRAAPELPLAWRLRKLLFFAVPMMANASAAVRRWRSGRDGS